MKTAQITNYGHADAVQIADVPVPEITNDNQVVIEIYAASLNPYDTKVREGDMQKFMPLDLPFTLGGDIAGIVTKVGASVTHVAPGDKIYGEAGVSMHASGAFAEYAVTAGENIARMPENTDFNEASALPLIGASAIQALHEHIALKPGQKILIQGGSGNIGAAAIQIAKHIGAYVIATAPTEAVEEVRILGADEVIDYKTQDFSQLVHGMDAVFDTVGDAVFTRSFTTLRPGGIAVTMSATVDNDAAARQQIRAIGQFTSATTAHLDILRELVEQGIVTPRIADIFPLAQVTQAFTVREQSGIFGKIVLRIR